MDAAEARSLKAGEWLEVAQSRGKVVSNDDEAVEVLWDGRFAVRYRHDQMTGIRRLDDREP